MTLASSDVGGQRPDRQQSENKLWQSMRRTSPVMQ